MEKKERLYDYIQRVSGRRPTECRCAKCMEQCRTPCLGTPLDILRIINAGYGDRLTPTLWAAGMALGLYPRPIAMIQANVTPEGWCTFRRPDGLCELHDKGLKPTEGKLSDHAVLADSYDPRRSVSWLVARTWLDSNTEGMGELMECLKGMIEKQKRI